MENDYKKAIELISKDYTVEEMKRILVDYAQNHPLEFCQGVSRCIECYKPWAQEVLNQPTKVDAIKKLRNLTGMSLIDAKDWVVENY